jgi:hypothetical protein
MVEHRLTRSLAVIAGLTMLALSLTLLINPVIAHHDVAGPAVTPTVLPGNPSCPAGTTEIKFDGGEVTTGATKTALIGTTTVRATIVWTDGMSLNFDVNNSVAAHVLVKGGDNANDYDYSARSAGGIRHDDGLIAPDNGGGNQPGISHVNFCLVLPVVEASVGESTAASASAGASADDGASLNVKKQNEDGFGLPGAIFTVDGLEGTFTTDEDGYFCVLGLPEDSVWLVTEIQAPTGYELADPAWQMVEVDNDGDCNSPDARFVNELSEASVPPSVEQSVEASAGGSTPASASAPASVEGSVLGGTGTPAPSTPDTALGSTNGPSPLPTLAFGAILVASLAGLAWVNVQAVRARR